ncbi:glycosyltransferase family 2 protein [Candidatus Woesearchaeota archaeon]|jgi:glycosyltransferase involved in cell wall biosynthesis|nr:glycosyltransferase family 2 protein [Candidatus Woesearchaeota archaeon]
MKVSLIIPCYNESKSIPKLLESCQTAFEEQDVEVIIVDNGSTDNTQEVLSDILANYSFIKLVTVKENIGYGDGILQGLNSASGEIIGWTHADLQTNPADINSALTFFEQSNNIEAIFVKGDRYGRSIIDVFFTIGMALFESMLMRTWMWDINAQPTLFHKSFFESWVEPPNDFSLDLFAYFTAKKKGLIIKRFPVLFSERMYGVSSWNISWSNKYKFIKRTLQFSFLLNQRLKK